MFSHFECCQQRELPKDALDRWKTSNWNVPGPLQNLSDAQVNGSSLLKIIPEHQQFPWYDRHINALIDIRMRSSIQVEVRDSPARDIFSLHVVLQGSHQMGRVLGTPPPSPPSSPSPGSSGRHSGWGTIFGVCPYGIGLRWDISGHPYRGFAQNFDTFHMGRVVWPGEPFLKKSQKFKKMHLFKKWTCPKNPEMSFSRRKKKKRRRPNAGNAAGSF